MNPPRVHSTTALPRGSRSSLLDLLSSICCPRSTGLARAALPPLLFALACAGCGGELYDQRLANTSILFAHMELLNQNLQGEWNDPSVGVRLRVPMQFATLAPPAVPEPTAGQGAKPGEEKEEEEVEIIDDRQPKYMNLELPGLRGAFQAQVKVLGQNDALSSGDAYVYVMTNHDLAEDLERAQQFEKDFVSSLSEALHETVMSENWREERIPPRVGTFVKPLTYRSLTISPSEDIAGLARQFFLYVYEQGEIRVIVMFVIPKDVDATEHLTERIPLCLETLDVAGGTKLMPPAGAAAPAAGNSGSSF